MRYREFLKSELSDDIPVDLPLPSGFHLVGHVALVHLNSRSMKYAQKIGNKTLEYDERVKSVAVRTGPTKGKTRLPSYSLVSGDCNTVTTHIESGVKFRLDPVHLTFSGGNKGERIHMSKIVNPGENVVDMFSCVGQFALHIAKSSHVNVTAIEINPEAFEFLLENIKLNRLEEKVTALLGDCREVHPKGVGDRVIMGYLHDTISYLPSAVESLTKKGGIIHMHMSVPELEVSRVIEEIDKTGVSYGLQSTTEVRRVKNYSPGVEHFVFDILLKRNKA
ncbi:MAG: class I SAM-dependent methyltransferase [Candidatus Thorarchaeota archaeon]|jgi:tRNA wybutosine-synthesizing protein 2